MPERRTGTGEASGCSRSLAFALCYHVVQFFDTFEGEERERKERKYFTSITMCYLLCVMELALERQNNLDN